MRKGPFHRLAHLSFFSSFLDTEFLLPENKTAEQAKLPVDIPEFCD